MIIEKQQLIYPHHPAPLSSVPHHQGVACIERFFSETFPLHLAIHRVVDALPDQERKYTDAHTHDVDEINIIIGDEDGLEYEIQLGDERFQVRSNASVYIPAGLPHSANVCSGSGYFVALRLPHRRQDL
jgi:hypothetical protein